GLAPPHHLAVAVDVRGRAAEAAQGPEVAHRALPPENSVRRAAGRELAPADHPSELVDAGGLRARVVGVVAQGAQVDVGTSGAEERVPGLALRSHDPPLL